MHGQSLDVWSVPQGFQQDFERGGLLPAAWVVDVVPGKRRAPVVKHPLKAPLFELAPNEIFHGNGHPDPGLGRSHIGIHVVHQKLPIDPDIDLMAILLELPNIEPAGTWKPDIDA